MSNEKTTEKIEAFWKDATAEDVARVMAGETVEARFRDEAYQDWACGFYSLCGWAKNHSFPWKSSEQAHRTFGCWKQCQVYREPSWWTERPDPGPEYRLLGKFPGEPKLATDEAWSGTSWLPIAEDNGIQRDCVWYRRRIEQPKPEPKFAVGQTVKVVGPKQIPALEWSSVGMAQYAGTTHTVKRIELLTNPPGIYYHLGEIDNWAFREDYLEAVELEPKHYVLRVGDSVETPSGHLIKVVSPGVEQIEFKLKAGFTAKLPNGQTITATEKGFEVTQ